MNIRIKIILFFCIGCVRFFSAQPKQSCFQVSAIDHFLPWNGEEIDTSTAQKDASYLFYFQKNEKNRWFKFEIIQSGLFTFKILPKKRVDDLNYFLFKDDHTIDFCRRMEENKAPPLRIYLSKFYYSTIQDTYAFPGWYQRPFALACKTHYAKSLQVEKGEVYYLLVNNCSQETPGFYLSLYLKELHKTNPAITENSSLPDSDDDKIITAVEAKVRLNISVVDEESGHPVIANIQIGGIQKNSLIINDIRNYSIELKPSQNIDVICNASGYLFYSHSFISPVKSSTINIQIKLKKIAIGETRVLPRVKFEPNNATFLVTSAASLSSLLEFLKANPTIKIEIQGHVNSPKGRNSIKIKKLSKKRAKAVYLYLIANGINKNRLSYKGFGNAFMIYPDPDRESQREENRRVEIKIL